MTWLKLTSAVDGGGLIVNTDALKSIRGDLEDGVTILYLIHESDTGYKVRESLEEIWELLNPAAHLNISHITTLPVPGEFKPYYRNHDSEPQKEFAARAYGDAESGFRLEVGKRYYRRDGAISGTLTATMDLRPNPSFNNEVFALFDGDNAATYTVSGYRYGSCTKDSSDLVREYVNAPTESPFKIEAGKRYYRRNRSVSPEIMVSPVCDPIYPFFDPATCITLTETGKHFVNGEDDHRDLVREYPGEENA